jgi:hypothetical protein
VATVAVLLVESPAGFEGPFNQVKRAKERKNERAHPASILLWTEQHVVGVGKGRRKFGVKIYSKA